MVGEEGVDFWRTIIVLIRRWYVILPVFLLTLGGVAAVYKSIPTRYHSTAVIVLTAPASGASFSQAPDFHPPVTNPLLNFGDGLNNSATILVQTLNRDDIVREIQIPDLYGTNYDVNNGSANPELLTTGPFVFVHGDSGSPIKAQEIVARVVQRARDELVSREKALGADPATFINLTLIVPPSEPATQTGGRIRPAAAALALGSIASLASAYTADSVFTAVARRRSQTANRTPRSTPVDGSPRPGAAESAPGLRAVGADAVEASTPSSKRDDSIEGQ